jgi:threonine dehydratase
MAMVDVESEKTAAHSNSLDSFEGINNESVSYADILGARIRIERHLHPTPMWRYPLLDELIGAQVFIKHENLQPTGAFKVRGGINFMSVRAREVAHRGVITFSTGNHGQSIAYAGTLFGVPVRVVVPKKANPVKVAGLVNHGAEVIFSGDTFDDARARAEELAQSRNCYLIGAANEPLLIAGVATMCLEMLDDESELDVVIVPVGGGSGAAGACIVAAEQKRNLQIIGVQSKASPAAFRSWRSQTLCAGPNRTFAEGIAVGTGFAFTQSILRRGLNDFILVSDGEIKQAIVWMLEKARTVAEGAAAATLAAAYRLRGQLAGLKVGLICSGGNSSLEHLTDALTHHKNQS